MRGTGSYVVVLLAWALILPVAQPATVSAADPLERSSSKGGQAGATAAVLAGLSITSPGPLSSITISPDLNCALNHMADAVGEFFDDTACATLLAANGVLRPGVHPGRRLGQPANRLHPGQPNENWNGLT